MIKVCYVTHEPNLTGASQSLLDMLDGLKDSDIKPIVLLRKKGPLEEELRKRNIEYYIIFYAQTIRPCDRKQRVKTGIKIVVNAIQEKRIKRFLIQEKVDVVHNNSLLAISGMKAAYNAGIPYVCHIRDLLEEDHNITPIRQKDNDKCISRAAKVVAISDYVYKKYRKYSSEEKSLILADGINTGRYFAPHKALFENKMIKLILSGRIQEGKRQLDAVQAVELLRTMDKTHTYDLFIAGGDAPATDYPNQLRKYIEEHGLNEVHMLGFVDLTEIRSICDISLMCSSNEAMGRVTIEGLLSGCLVIGADAGATPEIISDGETGFLYICGDYRALAECIMKAVNNIDNSRKVAEGGQKKALSYDALEYAKAIEKCYREAINLSETQSDLI